MTEEITRYYKLNVDDLPRGTAKKWAGELSPDGREKVKVMELQGSIYYVAVMTAYVAGLFEERLRRQDVRIESTTTPPPARTRGSASAPTSSRSSGGSRKKRGGNFWDDLFDGIGDFFDDLLD